MDNARNLFLSAAVTATLLFSAPARAEQADKYTKPHEPFTAYGMQVRMSLINPIDNTNQSALIPTVFQEIAPCRLTSTIALEAYASQWGGPAYQANESRRYTGRGYLSSENFINPCSEVVPRNAIGLVARFTITSATGDGEVHIDPINASSSHAATVLQFHKDQTLMFEAGVLFAGDGSFDVATWYAGADVQIDVLGYLIADPAPTAGPQGQKGDDQLRRIPERGVEQSAETLAQFFGQVLGGFAHEARQRNDRQAGGDKDINRAGMDQVLQHDRRRNEYQQKIEKILGREQSLHFLVVLVPSGKDGGPTRILFCGTWYGTRIFTGLTD
jgi:hypothetical protein